MYGINHVDLTKACISCFFFYYKTYKFLPLYLSIMPNQLFFLAVTYGSSEWTRYFSRCCGRSVICYRYRNRWCWQTEAQYTKWKERESRSVVSNSLWPHGLCSPWNSPGQNPGVGSCSLLQGIFPTQGVNPGLLIAGGFFTSWATRGAHTQDWSVIKHINVFEWLSQ